MRAEEQLQYLADFDSRLCPTRKHALNFLFCAPFNGFHWENGELVDHNNIYEERYKLVKPIERAEFANEKEWWRMYEEYKHEREPRWGRHDFEWDILEPSFSKLCNYPDDIKPDWKALLEECKSMLIADGIEI